MGYLKIVKLIKMKVRTVAAQGWRVGGQNGQLIFSGEYKVSVMKDQ
jgi:hypothetical protein